MLHSNWIKKALLLFVVGLIHTSFLTAQSREYLLKAGFIEKFTHFVEWPSEKCANDSIFLLSVIGRHPYGTTFNELFKHVKVNNKPVRIQYIQSTQDLGSSSILIIPSSARGNLENILRFVQGKGILTISDSEGFGKKGVIINMFLKGTFIRYEINQKMLATSNLKMSSLLLSSAESILK